MEQVLPTFWVLLEAASLLFLKGTPGGRIRNRKRDVIEGKARNGVVGEREHAHRDNPKCGVMQLLRVLPDFDFGGEHLKESDKYLMVRPI